MNEREILIAILSLPAGYSVDLCGVQLVRRAHDIEWPYAVAERIDGSMVDHLYVNAGAAVDYFLELRERLQLGADFV